MPFQVRDQGHKACRTCMSSLRTDGFHKGKLRLPKAQNIEK